MRNRKSSGTAQRLQDDQQSVAQEVEHAASQINARIKVNTFRNVLNKRKKFNFQFTVPSSSSLVKQVSKKYATWTLLSLAGLRKIQSCVIESKSRRPMNDMPKIKPER